MLTTRDVVQAQIDDQIHVLRGPRHPIISAGNGPAEHRRDMGTIENARQPREELTDTHGLSSGLSGHAT